MSNSAIPWTITHQAPLSVGILLERILVWVAMPPPGDLPNPGIELIILITEKPLLCFVNIAAYDYACMTAVSGRDGISCSLLSDILTYSAILSTY